jgi:demethylmenaquinone methyltransferase/2-methoxy-6-polyprenyl-1,4-benzoquinol methylase
MSQQTKTTHFGYNTVPWSEKETKVAEVFTSVASSYDLMNDVMSFGIHRIWKRLAVLFTHIKPNAKILDLAGGSGDLTKLMHAKLSDEGHIYLTDINKAMLDVGRSKLLDEGIYNKISFIEGNAECLPYKDNYFDLITIGFGLRNVTDKPKALASMCRVLKPGGKLVVLEFSKPTIPGLGAIYDWYSFNILPKMGEWLAKDKDSYQYLAESIRMHPNQQDLKAMIEHAGFSDCQFMNLTGGIVAMHTAYKY